MESEFYTTAEVAAKLGYTYDGFRQALHRKTLNLPFEGVRISIAKGKNAKIRWRKTEVDQFINSLGDLGRGI